MSEITEFEQLMPLLDQTDLSEVNVLLDNKLALIFLILSNQKEFTMIKCVTGFAKFQRQPFQPKFWFHVCIA